MMAASVWSVQLFHAFFFPPRLLPNVLEIKGGLGLNNNNYNYNSYRDWNRTKKTYPKFVFSAFSYSSVPVPVPVPTENDNRIQDDDNDDEYITLMSSDTKTSSSSSKVAEDSLIPGPRLQQTICSLPPVIFLMRRVSGTNFAIGLSITVTLLIIAVRVYVARKSSYSRPGSVADLVRRGQLNSDRRGISRPLKYEDPFNNPMVKVGKSNTTVEMCGKIYRLAPVTLTREQKAIHQKRRSRAYQWKRPTIFLKEGDSVPPDVDPDTVRWIPANHPFATAVSDIDEDLAQNNVYQKHGVPFRIQAEHEALQRKLEALQNDQKLKNLVIDPGAAKDFERPFKSNLKSDNQEEQRPSNGQVGTRPPQSDRARNSVGNDTSSEEMQKP
ncbi:hypothetical protein LguiB_020303 [Lonicera macranthoides]